MQQQHKVAGPLMLLALQRAGQLPWGCSAAAAIAATAGSRQWCPPAALRQLHALIQTQQQQQQILYSNGSLLPPAVLGDTAAAASLNAVSGQTWQPIRLLRTRRQPRSTRSSSIEHSSSNHSSDDHQLPAGAAASWRHGITAEGQPRHRADRQWQQQQQQRQQHWQQQQQRQQQLVDVSKEQKHTHAKRGLQSNDFDQQDVHQLPAARVSRSNAQQRKHSKHLHHHQQQQQQQQQPWLASATHFAAEGYGDHRSSTSRRQRPREHAEQQPGAAAAAADNENINYPGSNSSSNSSSSSSSSSSQASIAPSALTQLISSTESLTQLQQLLQRHADQLQQINVCAAYKAVVRLSSGTLRLASSSSSSSNSGSSSGSSSEGAVALAIMRDLNSRMKQQIRVARPWDLAQAAWACSKLQYLDRQLLDAIARQAAIKSPILLPQDIAQLASAYARLGHKPPHLLQLLQDQAIAKATDFEPWSLVHTAWALHVCNQDCRPLLEAASRQLPGQLGKLKALDMSTLLWLLAGHGLYDEVLLQEAAGQLARQIGSFPAAAVSQILVSFAALGFHHADLAVAATQAVQQQLSQQQYNQRQVAQCTFALAKMGVGVNRAPELFEASAAMFLSAPPGSYSPQLLCMLHWGLLLAGFTSSSSTREVMEQLVQLSHAQLPRFTADQMASIIRGMYRLPDWKQQPSVLALLTAAAAQLPHKLQHMNTRVLEKLTLTLSKQHRLLQQQQTEQQQPQQQQEVEQMLQACGSEWLRQHRQQQHTAVGAAAMHSALAASPGCEDLAAAAAEVYQGLLADGLSAGTPAAAAASAAAPQDTQQQQQQQQQYQLSGGSDLSEAAGASSSWVDSFVAGTSADGVQQEQQQQQQQQQQQHW